MLHKEIKSMKEEFQNNTIMNMNYYNCIQKLNYSCSKIYEKENLNILVIRQVI